MLCCVIFVVYGVGIGGCGGMDGSLFGMLWFDCCLWCVDLLWGIGVFFCGGVVFFVVVGLFDFYGGIGWWRIC